MKQPQPQPQPQQVVLLESAKIAKRTVLLLLLHDGNTKNKNASLFGFPKPSGGRWHPTTEEISWSFWNPEW